MVSISHVGTPVSGLRVPPASCAGKRKKVGTSVGRALDRCHLTDCHSSAREQVSDLTEDKTESQKPRVTKLSPRGQVKGLYSSHVHASLRLLSDCRLCSLQEDIYRNISQKTIFLYILYDSLTPRAHMQVLCDLLMLFSMPEMSALFPSLVNSPSSLRSSSYVTSFMKHSLIHTPTFFSL